MIKVTTNDTSEKTMDCEIRKHVHFAVPLICLYKAGNLKEMIYVQSSRSAWNIGYIE